MYSYRTLTAATRIRDNQRVCARSKNAYQERNMTRPVKPTNKAKAKPAPAKPAKPRQTGDEVSSIAGKVLAGGKPTAAEARKMAASLLAQDQTPGKRRQNP
jgi:hypothetical protein